MTIGFKPAGIQRTVTFCEDIRLAIGVTTLLIEERDAGSLLLDYHKASKRLNEHGCISVPMFDFWFIANIDGRPVANLSAEMTAAENRSTVLEGSRAGILQENTMLYNLRSLFAAFYEYMTKATPATAHGFSGYFRLDPYLVVTCFNRDSWRRHPQVHYVKSLLADSGSNGKGR